MKKPSPHHKHNHSNNYSETYFSKFIKPSLKNQTSCPICLNTLTSKTTSLITTCLHAYCSPCILKWSTVKPTCPLCNSTFHSLFCNLDSTNSSFHKFKVPFETEGKWVISESGSGSVHRQRRFERFRNDLFRVNSRSRPLPWRRTFGQPGSVSPDVLAERKLQWRASVYNRRLQAVPIPSRNCQGQSSSASNGITEILLQRIEPWIHRELQAILRDPDPSIIVHVATSLYIASLERKSNGPSAQLDAEENFLAPLQPFLDTLTVMFWHELREKTIRTIGLRTNMSAPMKYNLMCDDEVVLDTEMSNPTDQPANAEPSTKQPDQQSHMASPHYEEESSSPSGSILKTQTPLYIILIFSISFLWNRL